MSVSEALAQELEPPVIGNEQIIQEMKNELGDTFTFGGKEFKILSLKYDDYCEFLDLLSPLFETFINQASNPNAGIDVRSLVRAINKNIHRMFYLMIHNQDSEVTEEWIKDTAISPFQLGTYVITQVQKNRIAQDFVSFFALIQRSGMM